MKKKNFSRVLEIIYDSNKDYDKIFERIINEELLIIDIEAALNIYDLTEKIWLRDDQINDFNHALHYRNMILGEYKNEQILGK